MAVMYRDKVTLPGGIVRRASVYVVSAARTISEGNLYDKRTLIVSVAAWNKPDVLSRSKIVWMDEEYEVQESPVPIVALGRVDHWEITATRIVGG